MQLGGSVFLVTGGASGLGAATARMLAAGGGKVVIADLKEQEGATLVKELGAAAKFVRTDVTDEGSGKAAVAAALGSYGALHGLINCAGVVHGERILGKEGPHALASFVRVVNINLNGSFNMTRLAAEAMNKNAPNAEGERGVIVFTASVAAFDGQIGQPAYSASKAGLVGMTLPIARELARFGIRVMTIAPSLFHTGLTRGIPQAMEDALTKDAAFPKRMGRPEEYALAARAIFENPMLNGSTFRLDAGQRFAPK